MRQAYLVFPSIFLGGVLLVSSHTTRDRERAFLARIDTVSTAYRAMEVEPDSLIWPGDPLPDAQLVNTDGRQVSLRSLSGAFRYFYFYKEDCPACALLAPIWHDGKTHDSKVAHIAFSSFVQQEPQPGEHHFAWVPDSSLRPVRRVRSTPTLLIVDSAGQVISVVAGYQQIVNVTKSLGLLDATHVDTSLARSLALAKLRGLANQPR